MSKLTLAIISLCVLLCSTLQAQNTYTKQMRGGSSIYAYDVVATRSLRSTVTATTDPTTGNNFFFTKLDEKGNLLWSKTFLYPGAYGVKMAPAKDEAIVCLANVSNRNKRNGNLLFKIDSSGNLLWAKRITANFDGWFSNDGMVSTKDGTIYTLNFVPDGQSVQQFTEDGTLVWTKDLFQNDAPIYGVSYFAAATDDNGFIYSHRTGGLNLYYDHLYKISKTGEAEWSYNTEQPSNYYVYTQAANTRLDGKVEFLFFRYEYFVYTLLDPKTGRMESRNLGDIFSLQAYLRKHNIQRFNGVTFPFVIYTNDLNVFTKNFNFTDVAQEYPENFRYVTTIRKYDSLGRICPDFTIPQTRDADTITFGLSRSSFSTQPSVRSYIIADATLKVQDLTRLKTICEGEAETSSDMTDFAKTPVASLVALSPFVTLFPNPVTTDARVNLTAAQSGFVRTDIVSMQGRVVKSYSKWVVSGHNTFSISLSGLVPGIYLVKTILSNGICDTQKIIKN